MKFVSYKPPGTSHARVGVMVSEDAFINVNDLLDSAHPRADRPPMDIHALIEEGPALVDQVADLLQSVDGPTTGAYQQNLATVELLPAVQRPSKICCLALNNSANSDRIFSGPKHPAFFLKPSTALLAHGGAIRLKKHYGRVHPEPELALVIGKTAREVSAVDAYDHVFGYTIHNDLTSPTMRNQDSFHYRAIHPAEGQEGIRYVDSHVSYSGRYKGTDTFAPMGPWIVTRDEIPDPHTLKIECHVDGELFASDNTRNLFHKAPEVLAFISSYMTLLPGDIVSLGTALASGGHPTRAVQNADLNIMQGPVSVTIERIGRLTNTVTHT